MSEKICWIPKPARPLSSTSTCFPLINSQTAKGVRSNDRREHPTPHQIILTSSFQRIGQWQATEKCYTWADHLRWTRGQRICPKLQFSRQSSLHPSSGSNLSSSERKGRRGNRQHPSKSPGCNRRSGKDAGSRHGRADGKGGQGAVGAHQICIAFCYFGADGTWETVNWLLIAIDRGRQFEGKDTAWDDSGSEDIYFQVGSFHSCEFALTCLTGNFWDLPCSTIAVWATGWEAMNLQNKGSDEAPVWIIEFYFLLWSDEVLVWFAFWKHRFFPHNYIIRKKAIP